MAKPHDIPIRILPPVGWKAGSRRPALEALHAHFVGEIDRAAAWYRDSRRGKRRAARLLRGGAILFAAVAGILPIVSQALPSVAPIWAVLALAAAGLLVAYDRFFGFSSAWMRYVAAETRLRGLLAAFQVEWHAEMARWGNGEPTDAQLEGALRSLSAFVRAAHSVVERETQSWVAEFEGSLKDLDERAEAAGATPLPRPGGGG